MRAESTLSGPSQLLVAIATLMLQLALYDRQGAVTSEWVHLLVVLVLVLVVRVVTCKELGRLGRFLSAVCYSLLVFLPFVWDAAQRWLSMGGQPLEAQLALALRNMMLALVMQKNIIRSQKFASLASCFLALFSILWLMNRWTIALLFVYTLVGMWWLLGAYWDRISGCFLFREERCVPWKPVGIAAGLCGIALLLFLPIASSKHFTTATTGFLASSGGTKGQDEFAYGGVGDGPQLVSATENASSFGPIESELFLESKMPSLYDCFNEFSDPPPKKKKKLREKAIPLNPSQMQQNHQRRGTNKQPGREFNVMRRSKQETPKMSDLQSHALFQIAGRVPVHLALYSYDLWDGHTLTSSNNSPKRALFLDTLSDDGRNWVRFADSYRNALQCFRERHELRIINLKTDRVPSPADSIGVNIDKLHTESFFKVKQDGMLALDLDFIPQLTVLHVESLPRNRSTIPSLVSCSTSSIESDAPISALARQWTTEIDSGWKEVEAICARLREGYSLDAKHMAPEEINDAAKYFLFDSKQGPDYLFATSAALLIRSLGYEARVVSGFYADEKNYDRQSRCTSVYAKDAHFWIEVLAETPKGDSSNHDARQHWVAVDPSPGYEVLLAPESIWSQLFARAVLTWHALKRNPLPSLGLFALCAIAWFKRAAMCDILITVWWEVFHRWGDTRHRVIATLRLLDRRAKLCGYSRPKGLALNRWDLTPIGSPAEPHYWASSFRSLANWALYGEGTNNHYSPHEVNSLCRNAASRAFRSRSNIHLPSGQYIELRTT